MLLGVIRRTDFWMIEQATQTENESVLARRQRTRGFVEAIGCGYPLDFHQNTGGHSQETK